MPALKTNVTELPESRVRVEAEVSPEEVERRLNDTARRLGRDLRIPGFRKGKVPPPVVIRRVGREAVLDEAVRDHLGGWYADAIEAAGIAPVGDPQLDMGDLPAQGEPLTFAIEIGVRPEATLGEYKGLEVPRREPEVEDEAIDTELEGLQERLARLETADREAEMGDFVVLDYEGSIDGEPFPGGEGRDQLAELGSGRLVPGFEEQLQGARAEEERTVEITFPDDYPAEHLAGKPASFAVTVKEVKAKRLPDLDDDFATEAAGFDSMDELREDITGKLKERQEREVENEFREAAVDAAVQNAKIEVPEALIHARAHELWERMLGALARQGVSKEAYLRMADKEEEALVHEAMPEAEQALRREAVLHAVVQAEGIEPTEEQLVDALRHSAEHEDTTPEKLLERLRKNNRLDPVKEDIAVRQAVDLIVESAKPIDPGRAAAREKLWKPGDAK